MRDILRDQVGFLNFEVISSGDNPCAANVDGVERSRAVSFVSFSLVSFVVLCLVYYCHNIMIRTLHFVSNFQFSLYRMLARVRRLASRHSNILGHVLSRGLLYFWIIGLQWHNYVLFCVEFETLIRSLLNGIHGFLKHFYGGAFASSIARSSKDAELFWSW